MILTIQQWIWQPHFLKLYTGMKDENESEDEFDFGDTERKSEWSDCSSILGRSRKQDRDILGALAGESGMPGKLIGTIDMFDKYTFVEVPKEYARDVLHAMQNVKIKGKSIAIEPANQK